MSAPRTHTTIVYADHGDESITLTGTGYAVRCASRVAHENWPDARWCLEVLNKYGHLVRHSADRGEGA